MIEKIKELRERTGLGMRMCKDILQLNNNDVDEAIRYIILMKINGINSMPTFSDNGIRIIHEFSNLFDSKIKSGDTAYQISLQIKEEYPRLFEEYISLKR